MDWKPLADRVIVKKIDPPEKTESGIILVPEAAGVDSMREAEVVAVGPGKYVDGHQCPIDLVPGDIIGYSKHFGTDLDKEKGYMLLHEEDVLYVRTD